MPRRLAALPDIDPNTIDALLDSFALSMRASGRSPRTSILHLGGCRRFVAYLEAHDRPSTVAHVTPDDVRGFMVERADAGKAGNSIAADFRAVRSFYRWAVSEGIAPTDATDRVKQPRVAQPITPVFTDAELKALFAAAAGTRFVDRRDLAILRLLADTGMRRAELVNLATADIDTKARVVVIRRGKGGKGRIAAYGDRCAVALDRYLRARKLHRLAAIDALWLGRSGPLTYGSLRDAIAARAVRAGVADAHPHKFRHTFASRWLAAGGEEGTLMSLGGWSNSRLIHTTYGVATAADRAVAAAHRLGINDRL